MNKIIKYRFLLLSFSLVFLISLSSCGTTRPSTSSTASVYNEDLGAFRIALATYKTPTKEINKTENTETNNVSQSNGTPPTSDLEAVDRMLSRLAEKNSEFKSLPGYRIQLYTGSDSDKANAVKNKASYTLSRHGLRAESVYEEPLFKIKAGHFISQLEAQRQLVAIKDDFPEAILVPDKISMSILRARYQDIKEED
ncbi:SPOR domain-containing protein [Bernardetia sp. OM2101]|uniref:SPOR domain-containing protein n=1 Tax=Bernardetia sp. OM2101 TaxID=3344876 RepID=UPI0035CF0729